MRTIKFRAWDKRFLNMVYASPMAILQVQDSDHEIMQFTGLYDKDKREIYEGDIVTMHQFLFDGVEHEEECTGVIGYLAAEFSLKKIKSKFLQEYTGHGEGEFETPLCYFYGLHEESFEVIGNIYENKELIS